MNPDRVVLIADDEASIRRLVGAGLSASGVRVLPAADGDEAWALLAAERPAVALLDVQMPGRTGVDLVRALRATPSLAATRVILLSAKAQAGDVAAGLAAGADQYMTKPFSVIELVSVVERELQEAHRKETP